MKSCVVIGGGGHAKSLVDALQLQGVYSAVGITDSNQRLWGSSVLGVPVIGADDELPSLRRRGVEYFVIGVGSVSDNRQRKALFEGALALNLLPAIVVHPSAVTSPSAKLGGGTVVLAGAIVNADATVGENVIVNSGSLIEHDCMVGDHVHVCPGARIGGGGRLGTGSFIGTAASLKQGITVGDWATVAMGAVVLSDVGPGMTVMGIPARVMKPTE